MISQILHLLELNIMPVTKYFPKVWSSPKQKEQILFRVDPTTQRPLRLCTIKPPQTLCAKP